MSSPAIYDFDAIRHRMAQFSGEAPSGRYFREKPSAYRFQRVIKPVELVEDGHDWDFWSARCARCGHCVVDLLDSLAPKVCPGKITGEPCIECGERAVVHLGAHLPISKVQCLKCGYGVVVERGKPIADAWLRAANEVFFVGSGP